MVIAIVLPFKVPDNICKYAAHESKEMLLSLMPPSFIQQMDSSEDRSLIQKHYKRLSLIFTTLFY
jgi:hypothetical protein